MDSKEKSPGLITDTVTEVKCSQCGHEIDVAAQEPFTKIKCPDCGNIEIVPARLGSFLLLDLIGTGGMGGVYYAKDDSLGRFVAIKVMLKSLSENKEFVETFRHEAQAVAKLNHPNIVQIYSFGQEKGQLYIVMELVPGQRLDKMIAEEKQLDELLVIQVGIDIAEGLRAADEVGLIHGDVKPENILLDEKMQAKLADFGLATFANQAAIEGIWGTPYYIAPEKVKRQKVDARSDIYSLGATLYHAIAARPPFEGKTPVDVVKARLQHVPRELHLLRPKVNRELEAIISRMLQTSPVMRYPTYASLISDMRKLFEKLRQGKSPHGLTEKRPKKMIVPKKHPSPITVGTTTPGRISTDKPPPRPTRVIMTKKGKLRQSSALSEYKKQLTGTSQPSAETKKKPFHPKARRRVMLVMFLILAAAGIGLFLYHKKDVKIEARREAFALITQIDTAEEIYGKIQLVVTNVLTMTDTVQDYVEKATSAVFFVLGETVELPPPQTNEPPVASEEVPTNVVLSVEPEQGKEEPRIKTMARKVIAQAKNISQKAKTIEKIDSDALATRNEAVNARTSLVALSKVKDLSAHLSKAQDLEIEVKEALLSAEKAWEEVETIKTKVEKEQEARRKAEEEEAQRKAAGEEQRRKEEEQRALVESELNLANTARHNNFGLIKKHNYKEAVDNLRAQLSNYQTEEGKNALQILIERCSRLHGLKMFLIERLNAEPFKWGWAQGPTQDVLGADESHVKIKGRNVPWTEVGTAQMLKFIKHYLSSKKVRMRVLSEQTLAAAIFCYENGGKDAAANYAEKAINLSPSLTEEVKRLVPME